MTTKPARTRNGKTYPGGKALRRAFTKLAARKAAFAATKNTAGHTAPGKM